MPAHRDLADIDWTYSTIQSAADSHAIVEKLKPIYAGPWSQRAKQRGMTAIFINDSIPPT